MSVLEFNIRILLGGNLAFNPDHRVQSWSWITNVIRILARMISYLIPDT